MAEDNDQGTEPSLQAAEGEVVFGVKGSFTVRIRPDGVVLYEGDYKPDEAARVFWEAIAKAHPNANMVNPRDVERDLRNKLGETMEMLLLRVGRADLHHEQSRQRASAENATEHDKFTANIALRNLEAEVHNIIEFGRGLALARRIADN